MMRIISVTIRNICASLRGYIKPYSLNNIINIIIIIEHGRFKAYFQLSGIDPP